jgi:hypothetical protein
MQHGGIRSRGNSSTVAPTGRGTPGSYDHLLTVRDLLQVANKHTAVAVLCYLGRLW